MTIGRSNTILGLELQLARFLWLTLRFAGPCIGGAIVHYTHWRVIYWVQVGLAGLSLILSFFSIPSEKDMSNDQPKATGSKSATLNPLRVLKPLLYPNVLITVSSGPHLLIPEFPSVSKNRKL